MFSGVIIRIFGTELDLSGKSTFNLLFIENEEEDSPISKMKELINVISNEFGKDRRGKGKWSSEDENRITSFWEGREWILDKKGKTYKEFGSGMSQANLLFNIDSKSGVEFSILQANNLL